MNSELQILEEFKKGRLGILYEKVYPALLLFAVNYLGDKKDYLAEDCVQDAIFDAWKKRGQFESLSSLKSFLYTAIRNDAISIHRKDKVEQRYNSQLEEEVFFNTTIVDQETQMILYNAINGLPEKEKQVFEMCFVEGLKNVEVAVKLDMSDSSVKKYKARALEILRDKLNPSIFMFFFSLRG